MILSSAAARLPSLAKASAWILPACPLSVSFFLARGPVPQLDGPVPAAAGERLAIRREGQACHHPGVARKDVQHVAGPRITELHRTVSAGQRHDIAVGGIGKGQDRFAGRRRGGCVKGRQFLGGSQVPKPAVRSELPLTSDLPSAAKTRDRQAPRAGPALRPVVASSRPRSEWSRPNAELASNIPISG